VDIDVAVHAARNRVAPGVDSIRANAITAYHGVILRLQGQLAHSVMSPQGRRSTEAMVRLYGARIDALSREFA
jgi:hypothetical protein